MELYLHIMLCVLKIAVETSDGTRGLSQAAIIHECFYIIQYKNLYKIYNN